MDRFDDGQLDDFAMGFYHYGSKTAPYALIGMEEGGGNDFHNVQRRLDAWVRRGRRDVDDIKAFHDEFGEGQYFDPVRPAPQPTWSKLSALMCAINRQHPHRDTVRQYRVNELGRSGGQTWLTELLPLPSPNNDVFHYPNWSSLPWLQDRRRYMEHYAPQRAKHLQKEIESSRPQAVIFYGKDREFQTWWRTIAGVAFDRVSASGIELAHKDGVLYAIIEHTSRRGGYDYFVEAGRIIATTLQLGQVPQVTSERASGSKEASIQRSFWESLLVQAGQQEPDLFAGVHAQNGMILDAPYQGTNVIRRFAISIAEGWATTQIDIKADRRDWPVLKRRLDSLKAEHGAAFDKVCGPLEWEGESKLKRVWIKVAWRNLNLEKRSTWAELQAQMVHSMICLTKVIVPHVKSW